MPLSIDNQTLTFSTGPSFKLQQDISGQRRVQRSLGQESLRRRRWPGAAGFRFGEGLVLGPADGSSLFREWIDSPELEERSRGEEMPVVGVDFLEARLGGGGKVDGVASSEHDIGRQMKECVAYLVNDSCS